MLDAYLARIGLSGRPGIAAIHRAHATTIPFENLDPHRGLPVSLAPDDLVDKLVTRRRGGYCFEQNLLLAAALTELGATVEPMLARVRAGAAPGVLRPRTHLVLRVDGEWQADVGFGRGTLLEPIPFGPDGEFDRDGWRFRIVEDGGDHVLQASTGREWFDQYAVIPEPVPSIDIEVSNWFTSTRPDSPFVTGLVAARYESDAKLVFLSDWSGELVLTEATPGATTSRPVGRSEVSSLLSERFGLDGFAVGADGRVVSDG